MDWWLSFTDLLFLFGINLKKLIADYGETVYIIMFVIIFCETGLVVTPILPGDSMIFAAAALAAQGHSALNVHLIAILMILAAFGGDVLNYFIGRRLGPTVYERNYRFLNRKRLFRTKAFFERYGIRTIIVARFIPVIRTFAPFVAGVSEMNYKRFILFNFIGGVLWVTLYAYTGYLLGTLPFVKKHLEMTVLLMLVITLIPAVYSLLATKFWQKSQPSFVKNAKPPSPAPKHKRKA
jgi:membrane-associated protein